MNKNIANIVALIAIAALAAILSSRTHGMLEIATAGQQSRYAQSVLPVQQVQATGEAV